jgi:hypothetical protein
MGIAALAARNFLLAGVVLLASSVFRPRPEIMVSLAASHENRIG